MIIAAIVSAEIAFWAFLVGGLAIRYILGAPRVGVALLIATPFIDLALLVLTFIDLSSGSDSNFAHGLSALYIGFSVVFGPAAVRTMDAKFARRRRGGDPSDANTGDDREHDEGTRDERTPVTARSSIAEQHRVWLRCCLASGISAVLLVAGIAVVGLSGAFWLLYWLVVVASIVVVWWFIGPGLARRREKRALRVTTERHDD